MNYKIIFFSILVVTTLATFLGVVLAFAESKLRVAVASGVGLPDDEEVICTCFGITKGQIRVAVDSGFTDYEAIKNETQAGASCGTCEEEVCVLIVERTSK